MHQTTSPRNDSRPSRPEQRADAPGDRPSSPVGRHAPAHIASWSIGADLTQDPVTEIEVEASDGDADKLRARVAGLRAVDPNRAIALVHRGRTPVGVDPPDTAPDDDVADLDWRRRLESVVSCLTGRSDGFTGDTTPTSLARLRRWTEDELRSAGVPAAAIADVVLLVDELASNVEEHAPGWMTVDIELGERSVLVVVSDPQPSRMPVPADPPPDQPNGRGLLVVSALSVQWGVVLGRTSKGVWAEVDWPESS